MKKYNEVKLDENDTGIVDELDENDTGIVDELYYKLYVTREDKVAIVTMQWFDEIGYDQNRFLKDSRNEHYMFSSEERAFNALIKLVKPEFFSDSVKEFYDNSSNFSHMLIDQNEEG
jgi:hypothetical protein